MDRSLSNNASGFPAKWRLTLSTPHLVATFGFVNGLRATRATFSVFPQKPDRLEIRQGTLVLGFFPFHTHPATRTYTPLTDYTFVSFNFHSSPAAFSWTRTQELETRNPASGERLP